jgi:XTP/dITP diphosphohydrolase
MRRIKENKIVLASHNKGKLKEISELFDPFKIQTIPIGHFSNNEPKETEDTFIGNARIKAHYATKSSNLLSLSDDSGIMIDALNGAPGVYTADWAETKSGRDFHHAMTKVWNLLDSINAPKPIKAKFYMCFMFSMARWT